MSEAKTLLDQACTVFAPCYLIYFLFFPTPSHDPPMLVIYGFAGGMSIAYIIWKVYGNKIKQHYLPERQTGEQKQIAEQLREDELEYQESDSKYEEQLRSSLREDI